MLFDSWSDAARIAVVGAAAYLTLVLVLRASGKRTLSKLNGFDLVVTVALGSTLSTIALDRTVTWFDGLVALVVLCGLQVVVALTSSRSRRVRRWVVNEPTLLVREGVPDRSALAAQRVSVEEVRQVARSAGYGELGQVGAVVLETDGTLSVIGLADLGDRSTLVDVPFARPHGEDSEDEASTPAEAQDRDAVDWRVYGRFAAMISTSTVVVFLLTYTNVYDVAHIHWSLERSYMAVLMGSAMTIVMLGWMWGRMYTDNRVNVGIVAGALLVGAIAFGLSQTQTFVRDGTYMRAMIPHHSIAILTSERADLDDLRVRALAESIAQAQRDEIAEMEWLIDDIAANGVATTPAEVERRPVPADLSTLDGPVGTAAAVRLVDRSPS